MQLVQIPAFAPYSWFCKSCLPPLQPVFLILTYLQYNRDWKNRKVALHLVDGVFDVFNSPDDWSTADRGNDDDATVPSNEQMPSAWRMLMDLRHKLDLPLSMERPTYEPLAPIRCHLVSPDIALQTKALATGNKSDISDTTPATRHSPEIVSSLMLHSSLSTTPFVLVGQQVSEQEVIDTEKPLDMSDLDTWCSTLIQDAEISSS